MPIKPVFLAVIVDILPMLYIAPALAKAPVPVEIILLLVKSPIMPSVISLLVLFIIVPPVAAPTDAKELLLKSEVIFAIVLFVVELPRFFIKP